MTSLDRIIGLRERRAIPLRLTLADGLVFVLLMGLAGLLAIELWQSLQWRLAHDAAVVHYGAYLFEKHGFVPYRDLFDTVLPGAYLFQMTIGKTLGFGDLAFRVVDVGYLLALLGVTWSLLRPLGKTAAWAGAVVFGLVYLSYGPSMSLQRDYLGLLPIALALLVASRLGPETRGRALHYLLIGALFGATTMIKPHLLMGLPIVVLLAVANVRGTGRKSGGYLSELVLATIPVVAGVVLVSLVPIIWVWQRGGLPAFLDILRNYLPLYLQLNGDFKVLTGSDRLLYRITSLQKLGGYGALLAPITLGSYLLLVERDLPAPQRRLVVALLALTAAYGVYPALAGQFWNYHWIPFFYFATLSASLVLATRSGRGVSAAKRNFAAAVFVGTVLLTVRPAPDFYRQIMGNAPAALEDGRLDEIATFLRDELRPGDRVQPLDFVSGGINNALLRADAVVATRYQFDSQLYHNVSAPYTQARQQDFMAQLESAPPRFIIEYPDRPRPTGPDTIKELPQLRRFIGQRYEVVREGHGYLIYERVQ